MAAVLYLAATVGTVADEREKSLTAVVATVSNHVLRNDILATGNVAAWREIPISTEANGLAIVELLADEGDAVEKGQVLARLNSSILTAQISQQNAAIDELKASLAAAESDLNRARLVRAGVISGQVTEQRETLVKTTTAKLAAARAALEEFNARLVQTVIVAPAAGMIASRNIALGQVVQTGTEMFKLVQDGRIEVDALVSDVVLLNIKTGESATITGPNGATEKGRVRIVAPTVDARTRLGTVRITLDAKTLLKPGMFARVELATAPSVSLAVPLKSLVWRQSRAGVFKVDEAGRVAFAEVSTGRKTSDYVEIRSGLQTGENVVVEGAGLLKDGDAVRVEIVSVPGRAAP